MADQTLTERADMVMETIARHLDGRIYHAMIDTRYLKAHLEDLVPWLVEVFEAVGSIKK